MKKTDEEKIRERKTRVQHPHMIKSRSHWGWESGYYDFETEQKEKEMKKDINPAFVVPIWLTLSAIIGIAIMSIATADAATYEEIEARLQPTGKVCLMGDPCDPNAGVMVASVEAEPVALPGQAKYAVCTACHGAQGQGGLGPQLQGQPAEDIIAKLTAYKNGETRGAQSSLMWGQAANLTAQDMSELAEYIGTL